MRFHKILLIPMTFLGLEITLKIMRSNYLTDPVYSKGKHYSLLNINFYLSNLHADLILQH